MKRISQNAGYLILSLATLLVTAGSGAWAADEKPTDGFVDITPDDKLSHWIIEGTKFRDDAKKEPVWAAADGVVKCAGKGFGFLRYDHSTCDFILKAEYKMGPKCNSGLGIRTVPFTGPAQTRPSFASYEIQILDDAGKPADDHSSMSLYRYVAPTKSAAKPAGEWNQIEVTCIGPKIKIVLNGETVQDIDQSKIDAIKSKPMCGYICLQNHGKQIEWRKLQLKELKGDGESKPKADATSSFEVETRFRIETGRGWIPETGFRTLKAGETAIVVCDVWDNHWCKSAALRCDALAKKMAPVIDDARAHGVHIIHCPSDTMEFYKGHPARERMMAFAKVEPPSPIAGWCKLDSAREGELPIDDSDGGCDDTESVKSFKAWKQQHPAINIRDTDVITDNGQEVYNYLQQHGIKNIVYVGVHTNMCVLGRSFGIRQMTKLGLNTLLVRDLTDAMYNPKMRPQVSHDAGTDFVVQHVEKYWCPTIASASLKNFSPAVADAK